MAASGNYISEADVDSWPSGLDEAGKQEIIDFCEQLVEKITGTWFYKKALDFKQNGSGRNRLTVRIPARLVDVTAVHLCGIELDPSWYGFDDDSVFLDLCGSGVVVGDPEIYYRISQEDERGLFPRGLNNIRIVGYSGYSSVPEPIKKCIEFLIDAYNAGELETSAVGAFKSEKIGDYSYTKGLTGYAAGGVYTGIDRVDAILRHYIKQKKPIMGAV